MRNHGEDLRIRLSCCRQRQPHGRAATTKRGRRFIRLNTKRNEDRRGQAQGEVGTAERPHHRPRRGDALAGQVLAGRGPSRAAALSHF
jgi:hypothetical protein